MSGSIEKLSFDWEETGKLEIEVEDNMFATIRYRPSDKFVAETLAQLHKNAANDQNGTEQPNNHPEQTTPYGAKRKHTEGDAK